MRLFVLCLVAATLLWPALAQAPGDREFDECGDDDHTYPPEWHVLFDTWNYEDLFDGGPLQVVNPDGGSGWIAGGGGSCREQLRICDYRQATQPQNNWVFTQFINFDEATEIYVNASYQYISCINNARRGCNTLQTTVYRYETNGQVGNAARVNPANYLSNEVSVLDLAANENAGIRTNTFLPSPSPATGFYLGVQDTGTCGSVERITAYYLVCPRIIQGLVTLPEIPLPRVGTQTPITRNAVCAANSRRLQQVSLVRRAFADGRCESNAACECEPGYRNVPVSGSTEERCEACLAGTYRSASNPSSSCLSCPANTVLTAVAAPICACSEGFYRNSADNEGADDDCTGPPNACTELRNTSTTNTTVDISWRRPTVIGRDDYFYVVEVSDPERVNAFNVQNSNLINRNTRPTYRVSPLVPHTSYVIRVSVHNGVSDQDPDGHLRICEVEVMTLQGVPSPPVNVRGLTTVVVWQPPEQPNGVITGYDIQFFRGSQNGAPIPKGRNELFHEVVNSNIPPGTSEDVTVQVRAKNSRHTGMWSPRVEVDPPTSPPPTTSTPPTQSDLDVSISVDYDPPADFTPGPNEYRAASGPVTVTCTATGTGTGAVSYQWSSTCRSCPFQSATTSSILRAAVHSGDTGTHTCTATQGGATASASIDFQVVDAGVHVFTGTPRGNLPDNGLIVSDNPGSGRRLRFFCRSDSMSANVGQLIGLDGTTAITSSSFFAITQPQPGELLVENRVGSQSALTTSQQGVYTCRIPLESGQMRVINVGIYPAGFSTPPRVTALTSESFMLFTVLTCTTTGSPATTVSWRRDGQPVIIDGRTYSMVQSVTDRASATYQNILIVSPPALGSTFTCAASNTLGSSAISNSVTVIPTTASPTTTSPMTTSPTTSGTTDTPTAQTTSTLTPVTTMPPSNESGTGECMLKIVGIRARLVVVEMLGRCESEEVDQFIFIYRDITINSNEMNTPFEVESTEERIQIFELPLLEFESGNTFSIQAQVEFKNGTRGEVSESLQFTFESPPQGMPSSATDDDNTSLIIAVVVTFAVTAILVASILLVAFWVHHVCKAKKYKPTATNPEAVAPSFISLEKSAL